VASQALWRMHILWHASWRVPVRIRNASASAIVTTACAHIALGQKATLRLVLAALFLQLCVNETAQSDTISWKLSCRGCLR
jgi:hypothetical protein